MPETAEGVGGRTLRDETILIPHREIVLSDGTRLTVRPWGILKGALILERIQALGPKMRAGDNTAADLLTRAWDEVVDLVSMTVNIPRESMERDVGDGGWSFEDLLRVTDAMLEVCVVRSDGAGALPLLITLMARLGGMFPQASGARQPAPTPSSGSSRRASSKASSGAGSASRKNGKTRKRGSRRSSTS